MVTRRAKRVARIEVATMEEASQKPKRARSCDVFTDVPLAAPPTVLEEADQARLKKFINEKFTV
jgi:hypothetical protein